MGDGMPFIPAWFDDLKMTQRQYRIACRIARRKECTESARSIAAHCGMSRNLVVSEIKNLIEIGLVARGFDKRGKPCFRLKHPDSSGTNQCQSGTDECQSEEEQVALPSARVALSSASGGTNECQSGTDQCTKVLLPEGTPKKVHSNVEKSKRPPFVPPTQKEVEEFLISKELPPTAASRKSEDFINYYSDRNWKVGKVKMTYWKRTASQWANRWLDENERRSGFKNGNQPPREKSASEYSFKDYV